MPINWWLKRIAELLADYVDYGDVFVVDGDRSTHPETKRVDRME